MFYNFQKKPIKTTKKGFLMQKRTLTFIFSFSLLLPFCADGQKIFFSFDGETGEKPSQFRKERRWSIGGDDTAGTVQIIKALDHANGGKALKITRKSATCDVPIVCAFKQKIWKFKAGTTYLVSGWFKGRSEGLAQIQLTSPWEKKRKQWFKPINFRVDKEWKRYSFEFKVPEATPDSTLSLGKLYLLFGLFQNSPERALCQGSHLGEREMKLSFLLILLTGTAGPLLADANPIRKLQF